MGVTGHLLDVVFSFFWNSDFDIFLLFCMLLWIVWHEGNKVLFGGWKRYSVVFLDFAQSNLEEYRLSLESNQVANDRGNLANCC